MPPFVRNLLIWVSIVAVAAIVYTSIQDPAALGPGGVRAEEVSYSRFLEDAKAGRVRDFTIAGDRLTGHFSAGGTAFTARVPPNENVVDRVEGTGVQITAAAEESGQFTLLGFLLYLAPTLLLLLGWFALIRYMQGGRGGGGGGGALGFGRSRARMLNEARDKTTFADVAGIEEAKEELQEIVEFLKDPERYQRLGGKIPKGALLVGSPGTGKTLIAKAVAGEAGVPFFSISGSDFVEMFVGVGASRVRDMFEQGKRNAPCIIFIDEIDAVGRQRGTGFSHDEREQTLNQLLVEMDGFEMNEGVIILAATNRPDVLDQALLRPGRFDRQIVVPLPDITGREAILKVHMKDVPMASDVDAHVIARGTPGFAGAELANLVNEAALLAARRGRRVVSMAEMEEAKDKVMMGAERRSMVMTEDEKKLTAYHEAGHALVALHEPASDPIHKATIVPRGRALGLVMRLPERDRLSVSREKLLADLAVGMGGRAAEALIFGHAKVTTGASSDIQQATRIARAMVMKWGLSDALGPLDYDPREEESGPWGSARAPISEKTAEAIDAEVKAIVDAAYARAESVLRAHEADLHTIAKALLEYEMLSGEEIKALLAGEPIQRASPQAHVAAAGGPPPVPAVPAVGGAPAQDKGQDKDKDKA
ncbi:MAG: ATP-dependent zinc metalloprotease FtsH [Alphaproteobacteria bacterium]|jgi:cell division protease FtsH|nr:ATP-dependent zinc metalloprotease FtsH [Alphaproteobacteria bacterium]